jgi:hypothetical protein
LYQDTGLIIGTSIVLLFGLFVAIGLPMLINRQSTSDLPFERAVAIKWMRILGWILTVVSAAQLVIFRYL